MRCRPEWPSKSKDKGWRKARRLSGRSDPWKTGDPFLAPVEIHLTSPVCLARGSVLPIRGCQGLLAKSTPLIGVYFSTSTVRLSNDHPGHNWGLLSPLAGFHWAHGSAPCLPGLSTGPPKLELTSLAFSVSPYPSLAVGPLPPMSPTTSH